MKALYSLLIHFIFLFEVFKSQKRNLLSPSQNFQSILETSMRYINDPYEEGNIVFIPFSRIVIYTDNTTIFSNNPIPTLIAADLSKDPSIIAAVNISPDYNFALKIELFGNFYVGLVSRYSYYMGYFTTYFLDLNKNKFIKVAENLFYYNIINFECGYYYNTTISVLKIKTKYFF